MNILFVMYDQLRWDYLSCAGHPHLHTPNFDRVAAKGVRFSNAYVQSPICGPSRMSIYTGRYCQSHGATWNGIPLRAGEFTLGDHLRNAGMDCYLIGKTHMKADLEGMARLGLTRDSVEGARVAECGFDIWVRDDGLWGEGPDGFYMDDAQPYNAYLRSKGYDGQNPWHDYANAAHTDGDTHSGWFLKNAGQAANIKEEDSETPWLTTQAIQFMEHQRESKARPWCAHVSYIKPHWPLIAPAPYNDMYGPNHVPARKEHSAEADETHPVFATYRGNAISKAWAKPGVRERAIPTYMGLIKQCDDQLGRLLDYLEETDQAESTMIVLTSDHGDYLGDHGLGEKNFHHEESVKVPMIIYDPRAGADTTRGTVCDALVEAIDVVPTFVEAAGGTPHDIWLEGRSLLPWLEGTPPEDWRDYVISEFDYGPTPMCTTLNLAPQDARMFMVFDGRYKLLHTEGGFRPMLFDLESDPDEFHDLAKPSALTQDVQTHIDRLYTQLFAWFRRASQRVTKTEGQINEMRGKSARRGILPWLVEGDEVPDELTERYRRATKPVGPS